MLSLIATCVLALGGGQADLKSFRNTFALRAGDAPTSKPDPAIQKCMGMIADRIRREATPSAGAAKVEQILSFYARGVEAEETFETNYRSIGGAVSWGQGRVAVGVRMGGVSSLRVFNTANGKLVSLATSYRAGLGRSPGPNRTVDFGWLLARDSKPYFLPGGTLFVDSPGIQDAGVRYAYDLWFLEPGAGGYPTATTLSGLWTLQEEGTGHFRLDGTTLTQRSLDPPSAFFTDNVTTLFQRIITYELRAGAPTFVRAEFKDPNLRDLDGWMKRVMGRATTEIEKRFVAAYGKKPQMLSEYKETSLGLSRAQIELTFDDKKYIFRVARGANAFTVEALDIQ